MPLLLSDHELSKGASRPSIEVELPPEDQAVFSDEWDGMEVDMAYIAGIDDDYDDDSDPGTVVDVRPSWMNDDEL